MRLGLLLTVAGALLVGGYLAYRFGWVLALTRGVPWALRLGVPLLALGLLIGLGVALWDRLRPRGPGGDDIEGAQP